MDRYLDPRKWCPLYTDTDSLYISVAGQNIHELVKTDLVEEFYNDVYANWFPSECCDEHHSDFVQAMTSHRLWVRPRCCEERFQWDKRTPGLFKVEWQGKGMVSLCSKTYYCTGPDEDKLSSKGLQKSRNKLSYDQYKEVLFTSQTSGLCYIYIYIYICTIILFIIIINIILSSLSWSSLSLSTMGLHIHIITIVVFCIFHLLELVIVYLLLI